jgi:hypothetical protein
MANPSFDAVALVALTVVTLASAVAAQGSTTAQADLRIANCKIGATDLDQCDTTGYVIRVAVFSAPGLIVAAMFVLATPLYLIGKYCCNCCGGRDQRPNFCCPADDLAAIYDKGDILRPKIILLITLLAAIGAFVWGYVGGGKLESGLVDFGDQISNIPVLLRAELDAMNVALTVQVYSASSGATSTVALLSDPSYINIMTEANKTLTQLKDLVGDNIGSAQDMVKQYSFIVFVFFAIPAVILIIGGVFAVCNIRRFGPMTLVWLCFLFGALVWICHAVFCLGSMVVSDACTEIHGVAYEQQNILPALVGCKNSMFDGFIGNFDTLRTDYTKNLCNSITPFCYDTSLTPAQNVAAKQVLVCPSPMDCTTVTFGQMAVWMETAFYTNKNIADMDGVSTNSEGYRCTTPANLYSCYLDVCSSDCTNSSGLSDIGRAAKQFSSLYEVDRKISNVIDTKASQYANCDSLFSIMIAPMDPSCKTIAKALIADRQASGLLGLCMIAAVFCLAWGAKRFISLDEANVPQEDKANQVQDIED